MKNFLIPLLVIPSLMFSQNPVSSVSSEVNKQYSHNLLVAGPSLIDSIKVAEKNNRAVFWGMGFGYVNIGSMRIGAQLSDEYSLDFGINNFEGDGTNTASLKFIRYFDENILLYFNALCFDLGYGESGLNKTFAMEFYFLRESNSAKLFSGLYTLGFSYIQKNDSKPIFNIHFQIGFNLNL